jgi:hypothetical protein
MPRAMPSVPHRRHLPCHRHSQEPPSATRTTPDVGRRGIDHKFPGNAATHCATRIVTSMPQPIGTSANFSRPNGIKRQATTPQGSVHIAEIGTAITLASGE